MKMLIPFLVAAQFAPMEAQGDLVYPDSHYELWEFLGKAVIPEFDARKESLQTALERVRRSFDTKPKGGTPFQIRFLDNEIGERKVSISLRNLSAERMIEFLCGAAGADYHYSISKKEIVIFHMVLLTEVTYLQIPVKAVGAEIVSEPPFQFSPGRIRELKDDNRISSAVFRDKDAFEYLRRSLASHVFAEGVEIETPEFKKPRYCFVAIEVRTTRGDFYVTYEDDQVHFHGFQIPKHASHMAFERISRGLLEFAPSVYYYDMAKWMHGDYRRFRYLEPN